MSTVVKAVHEIPEQKRVPWGVAVAVSWGSLRRRLFRSLITMAGVILAIAFLTYMLVTKNVTQALIAVHDDALNLLLQKAGVDIYAAAKADKMMWLLLILSLLACLVGITNAMLMSVSERIKEIGTLKCLGALDSFIVKSYLIESSLQGVIGTALGVAVGLLVACAVAVINYGGFVGLHFPLSRALRSVLVSVAIGSLLSVAASIAPAYAAARKQPVDAMRIEE
ncbi:MAG: FtsX-like permease family protein [Kiritimatiellae bacterium]|nr:FtsX-like permease family protein [Kiritimatiellia bacterium]